MQAITQLGIDYLSTLDYIDLTNLCRTNKQFATICDDNVYLRRILFNTNDSIYIPPNFDIALAMKQLDNEVEKLFYKNYPPSEQPYPRWINEELFITHMKKIIYDQVYNDLEYYIQDAYSEDELFIGDVVELELSIALAFTSILINFESYFDDEIKNSKLFDVIENKIILSKHFVDYIKPSVLLWIDDDRQLQNGLKDLLFLRRHTFLELSNKVW